MNENIKAFPSQETHSVGTISVTVPIKGMDLRDYFAGQVISVIVSQYECGPETNFAEIAYKVADMLMQARSKKS